MFIAPLLFVSQAEVQPFLRYPDIHGEQIVFTSEGDLWLGNWLTGQVHRITADAGTERNAAFSPDGTQIAFEGEYDGERQAYVMPTSGGAPRKLTSVEQFRAVTGWTSDGKSVVVRYLGYPTNYTYSTVPAQGGVPKKLPLEFASHVSFSGKNGDFAFTRFNRWYSSWFRYIGGMQNQIWTYREGKPKPFTQITKIDGTNEFPVWCGDRIYFANEKQARFTLMSVPAAGGTPKVELPAGDEEIRELSTDGKRVVFERGNTVQIFDPETKDVVQFKPDLASDLLHTRKTWVSADDYQQSLNLSATGKRALVEARGQILSLPAGDGEARVWKAKDGVRFRHPSMSKDAKKVAYVSDETGEQQVYIADADGSNPVQLTTDKGRQLWGTRFSPDGKWIAFTDSKMNLRVVNTATKEDRVVVNIPNTWFSANFDFSPNSEFIAYATNAPYTTFGQLALYRLSDKATIPVSDGAANDSFPTFTADGKYLAFVSNRNLGVTDDPAMNQLNTANVSVLCLLTLRNDLPDPLEPKMAEEGTDKSDDEKENFRIDTDGLYQRRVELPISPAQITGLAAVGDRILYQVGSSPKYFDLGDRKAGDLEDGQLVAVAPDHQSYATQNGGTTTVYNANAEKKENLDFGGLRLKIDPVAEWKEIYWDAWRHMRDYFYVSNMNGVDWQAIGDKYARMLPSVRSRDELDELIRWFQSEVGSSHEYLSPGDSQDIKKRVSPGFLGCEFAADPSGFYKISKIYRGDGFRNSEMSPLLGVGRNIQEGMYLIAVGGEPVRMGQDPCASLAGRVGKTVSITVNTVPSESGAKTYHVKPVGDQNRMRYLDWVAANRRYVEKASGGKLGYIHLAAMTQQDMSDFIKQYFAQRDKDALVIDGRFNNGGYIQTMVNRILNEKLTGFFNQRDSSQSWTRQSDYFPGPKALLINEFDISCGEEFPHRFRDLKIGPLIGKRTMGGEVGSSPGWPLVDGGVISVPNYGMWTPDGQWAIEGQGVSPDIEVESDPNLYIQGRDAQLDRAISYLMEELKKHPVVRPTAPTERDRVKHPG